MSPPHRQQLLKLQLRLRLCRRLRQLRGGALRHWRLLTRCCVVLVVLFVSTIALRLAPDPYRTGVLSTGDFGLVRTARLPPEDYPSPNALQRFVEEAVQYIVRANSKGTVGRGSFAYRYSLRPGAELFEEPGYNTLRHAGAMYALADACARPDARDKPHCAGAEPTLLRAARWLLDNAVAPLPGVDGVYGVWSKPSIETPWERDPPDALGEVRLGGLGLGLVALTSAEEVRPGFVDPSIMTGIARFTTDVMRRTNGSSYCYFDADDGRPDPDRMSNFYPGEAALGLVRLYRHTGIATYLDRATETLNALHSQRVSTAEEDMPCDHWALIATANLWRQQAFHAGSGAHRALILHHAKRVTDACHRRDVHRTRENVVKAASFSTGLEAMLAMLPILATEDNGWPANKVSEVFCLIKRTVGALLPLQYGASGEDDDENDTLRGAMPARGYLHNIRGMHGTTRAVVRRDLDFQIDYTQHALSAVLTYVRAAAHPVIRSIRCDFGKQPYVVQNSTWVSHS